MQAGSHKNIYNNFLVLSCERLMVDELFEGCVILV